MEEVELLYSVAHLFVEDLETNAVLINYVCDLEDDEVFILSEVMNERRKVPKIKNFTIVTVPSFSLDDFRSRYRLTRHCFETLLQRIAPFLPTSACSFGRPPIHKHEKLLIFLDYLGHQSTHSELSTTYNGSFGKVNEIIKEMSELIVPHISSDIIKWPTENEALAIAADALQRLGFPGVIGAIDGSYIPIITSDEGYKTRKMFPALTLQAVARPDMSFTDVFVGCSGRMHDYRVLQYSPLHEKVESGDGFFGLHLLGDGAYRVTKTCMIPYTDFGNLTTIQKNFNKTLSSGRMVIERAFGCLKERFRRLKSVNVRNIRCACLIIISACTFHNLCIEEADEHFLPIEEDTSADIPLISLGASQDGAAKRDNIANFLSHE